MVRELYIYTFSAYVFALIFIVWIYGSMPMAALNYNLVPFKTILGYASYPSVNIAIKNVIGNLILTVPLGIYAWFKIRLFQVNSIFYYALIISFIFEGVQLLLYWIGLGARSIDVDDVILNTIGCIAGYYITSFVFRVYTHNKKKKVKETTA
ncbi:VanZ family protein [Paenibacillus aurantiacus]|uniref:VanZ family protein n=1 Tax=Paenibacillus aurantiacus TaxID=1936118 RepID=A0ABV5KLL2_9BACL